ncbi:MAG: radical SAM family heme chaperone HemW [Shimia sp.]
MIPLAVYVHWPFCAAKCPYCDFNSHVVSAVDHEAWSRALVAAVNEAARTTADRTVSSIFFGGGTPSLMAPTTVDAVIDAVRRNWPCVNNLEISLEANPTSVEARKLEDFRSAGVTRISLGVQALDDPALIRLGRLHSAEEALSAVETAKGIFERVSFDLIYARQDQSMGDWEKELGLALSFEPDHLALYQLTIEPGTMFARRAAQGRLPGLPDEDLQADMYHATQALADAAGLPAYEVSNHARHGEECRHNLSYWRGHDFVGIGPGAHGRVTIKGTRYATTAAKSPAAWLAKETALPGSSLHWDPLSSDEEGIERTLMGLRTREGVSIALPSIANAIDMDEVAGLEAQGFLIRQGDRLVVPPAHWVLLNAILAKILS